MDNEKRKKFYCRHCGEFIYVDGKVHVHPGERLMMAEMSEGCEMESYICNNCGKVNIFLSTKHYGADGKEIKNSKKNIVEKHIFPFSDAPKKIKYVPAKYMHEYNEAASVKEISPKSCALICRRILEMILENECGCTKFNLGAKVDEYIAKATPSKPVPEPPSEPPPEPQSATVSVPPFELLEKSMKYIVNAGNAMAHDKKDMNDNLIKLKSSDCDYMLKALETVFDEIFVKPKKVKRLDKQLAKVTPKSKG